jgi:hypothetical protein
MRVVVHDNRLTPRQGAEERPCRNSDPSLNSSTVTQTVILASAVKQSRDPSRAAG